MQALTSRRGWDAGPPLQGHPALGDPARLPIPNLPNLRQSSERLVPAPAIRVEISVQGKNFTRRELLRHTNQARIREVDSPIPVFTQAISDSGCSTGELKRNLKNTRRNVFYDRIRSPLDASQQIATLGNHCFAGNHRSIQ